MGSPLGPANVNVGDVIRDKYLVKKKLGEGSCGTVYLVQDVKDKSKAAMKVEPFMKSKEDEILKMEVYVLRKMQKSKHVCRLLLAGKGKNFSFLIMSLLGKELSDIRRRLPDRKMSTASVLKIGIQVTQAIEDMHCTGFVHRDVKPANFATGHERKNLIFIFDFGLARQIMFPDKNGQMKLREPRKKVTFRGTVRYCSVNVHSHKEQGRHDDLWSLLFMLIELITATLPWKGMARKDSGHVKEFVNDRALLTGCPSCFADLLAHLKELTYADVPKYSLFINKFTKELERMHVKLTDPFDWEVKRTNLNVDLPNLIEKDATLEIDKEKDRDSNRIIDESVDSAASSNHTDSNSYAQEDTLDVVQGEGSKKK